MNKIVISILAVLFYSAASAAYADGYLSATGFQIAATETISAKSFKSGLDGRTHDTASTPSSTYSTSGYKEDWSSSCNAGSNCRFCKNDDNTKCKNCRSGYQKVSSTQKCIKCPAGCEISGSSCQKIGGGTCPYI